MSRERKKAAALHEKMQLLRSITHSHALSSTSIIMDASEYIKDLKQKVARLNQEIAREEATSSHKAENSFPTVSVETLGHGFLVNVSSDKSCPGLLVSVLEAFEELGLTVLQATTSCADAFRLEAVGGGEINLIYAQSQTENVDEDVVRRVVLQAMRDCGAEQGDQ